MCKVVQSDNVNHPALLYCSFNPSQLQTSNPQRTQDWPRCRFASTSEVSAPLCIARTLRLPRSQTKPPPRVPNGRCEVIYLPKSCSSQTHAWKRSQPPSFDLGTSSMVLSRLYMELWVRQEDIASSKQSYFAGRDWYKRPEQARTWGMWRTLQLG